MPLTQAKNVRGSLTFVFSIRIITVLAAGDTTQALQYFNAQAQAKYGPVLTALATSLPQIAASFSAPQLMSASGEVGEYVVSRTIDGVNQSF